MLSHFYSGLYFLKTHEAVGILIPLSNGSSKCLVCYVTVEVEDVSLNENSVTAMGKTKLEQIISLRRHYADREI